MPRRKRPPPPPSKPRLLSAEQEAAARAAWLDGRTRDEVARAAGVTVDILLRRLQDQLADLPRRGRGGNRRPPADDPTEAQIWGPLTAEIQATWSDLERARHWVGGSRGGGVE